MADVTWLLLAAAAAACLLAFAWFALAMEDHWRQVHGHDPRPGTPKTLRIFGIAALATSLALCLAADHASMAVLVWVMLVPVCVVAIALTLAWRPAWLRRAWSAGRAS